MHKKKCCVVEIDERRARKNHIDRYRAISLFTAVGFPPLFLTTSMYCLLSLTLSIRCSIQSIMFSGTPSSMVVVFHSVVCRCGRVTMVYIVDNYSHLAHILQSMGFNGVSTNEFKVHIDNFPGRLMKQYIIWVINWNDEEVPLCFKIAIELGLGIVWVMLSLFLTLFHSIKLAWLSS